MRIIHLIPKSQTIVLGRKGENKATRVDFDVRQWLEDYPTGQVECLVTVPGTSSGYLANIILNNGIASWTVTSSDTSTAGDGQAELTLTDTDGTKVRSVIMTTQVIDSLADVQPSSMPEYIAPWVDTITATSTQARAAQTSAQAAATLAGECADDAATSEANALSYKTAAEAAAESASSSKNTAITKAAEVTAKAVLVEGYKETAEEASVNALAYKTAANASKIAAKASEDAASVSASNASSAASTASQAAQTATEKAEEVTSTATGLAHDVAVLTESVDDLYDDVDDINDDIATIPHPNSTTPTVGQMYKVSSIADDGKVTLEPCDIPTVPVRGVQVMGNDLTPDENGKVNIPKAAVNQAGVCGIPTSGYAQGIMPWVSNGIPHVSIDQATASNITNRDGGKRPIVPSMLNTAVKAALTDSKRIGHNGDEELTDEEKGNACSVLGAERSAKWELIRTINGDGETRRFTVSDELVHLYYAVYVDENVAMPVLSVNAYISTTVSADSTRVLYHYMGASNQSYKRKSTGRCIKMGNMYTSELTSYISNTNGTTKQSVYFGDMNDIISNDNIHFVTFFGSTEIPLGCTIKVFGVRA